MDMARDLRLDSGTAKPMFSAKAPSWRCAATSGAMSIVVLCAILKGFVVQVARKGASSRWNAVACVERKSTTETLSKSCVAKDK
jgi:hypothetical protein